MSILAVCPHCGFSETVSQTLEGRMVRCPRCAKTFKIVDPSHLHFQPVEEASRPACDVNVNVKAQPKDVIEHRVSELRVADGYLYLTTRHLRGVFRAKVKESGKTITLETEVDTLLSGVVGYRLSTVERPLIKILLGVLGFSFIMGGGSDVPMLAPIMVVAPPFFWGLFLILIAILFFRPKYYFYFIVMGTEYAIHLPDHTKVQEANAFMGCLKSAKRDFERTL